MLCGVLCGVRCSVHTYWLGYRCQGCGPHTVFFVAIILAGMRRNKDSAHVLCPLCVNEPDAFGGRNNLTDILEQVMEMNEYAPTYPTCSAECFSSDSCFRGWKRQVKCSNFIFTVIDVANEGYYAMCKRRRIFKPLAMHWKPKRLHSFRRRPFRPAGTFQMHVHKQVPNHGIFLSINKKTFCCSRWQSVSSCCSKLL